MRLSPQARRFSQTLLRLHHNIICTFSVYCLLCYLNLWSPHSRMKGDRIRKMKRVHQCRPETPNPRTPRGDNSSNPEIPKPEELASYMPAEFVNHPKGKHIPYPPHSFPMPANKSLTRLTCAYPKK